VTDFADDLALAERAALAAGEVLLRRFGRPVQGLEKKSSATDPVSDADRAAEETIRELLAAERPDDGLLAEEGSHAEAESGRRWVVDPLDGTVNYLYGFPAWCVSVALEDEEGGAVGVVHDPVRQETFQAVRGVGSACNGAPIRVRERDDLSHALVATGFGYERERRAMQAEVLRRVLPEVRDIRRAGAAALDLSWLAAGRLDAYWERGLNPWDWAAGRLLILEAGGAVAELPGEPYGLAAANPALLPGLLELVTG
jgi:fructose-1,6-bisphosphatase/inositol monophosphatase family enzyme